MVLSRRKDPWSSIAMSDLAAAFPFSVYVDEEQVVRWAASGYAAWGVFVETPVQVSEFFSSFVIEGDEARCSVAGLTRPLVGPAIALQEGACLVLLSDRAGSKLQTHSQGPQPPRTQQAANPVALGFLAGTYSKLLRDVKAALDELRLPQEPQRLMGALGNLEAELTLGLGAIALASNASATAERSVVSLAPMLEEILRSQTGLLQPSSRVRISGTLRQGNPSVVAKPDHLRLALGGLLSQACKSDSRVHVVLDWMESSWILSVETTDADGRAPIREWSQAALSVAKEAGVLVRQAAVQSGFATLVLSFQGHPPETMPDLGGLRVQVRISDHAVRSTLVDLVAATGATLVPATERAHLALADPSVPASRTVAETIVVRPVGSETIHPDELPFPCCGDTVHALLAARFGEQHTPLRILVVDDDAPTRNFLQWGLEASGHSVDLAADGQSALTLLSAPTADYDAVLTDLEMPVMDGITFLRAATQRAIERSANPLPPFVALTGHGLLTVRRACLQAGFADILRKPISLQRLSRLLIRISITEWNHPSGDEETTLSSGRNTVAAVASAVAERVTGTSEPMAPFALRRALVRTMHRSAKTISSTDSASKIQHEARHLEASAALLGYQAVARLARRVLEEPGVPELGGLLLDACSQLAAHLDISEEPGPVRADPPNA